ncbi:threonine synthase [Nocardia seriolae]|uniref:Threonine synthase n=1 Tax=Nocardia seriolae TaxID=37332 RepID=A0ABC9Z0Y3_9NOCA|nr:hypothetical protein NSERKGN1266_42180 [Nocardia seriolae]BEK95801.1 hypothetical protein NSER024013_37070 [Nocardia seriolae]GAM49267.1 threonine synthase [Nocardia seriolae]GAP31186.1 threonine synthase [Nocardia seriolae]
MQDVPLADTLKMNSTPRWPVAGDMTSAVTSTCPTPHGAAIAGVWSGVFEEVGDAGAGDSVPPLPVDVGALAAAGAPVGGEVVDGLDVHATAPAATDNPAIIVRVPLPKRISQLLPVRKQSRTGDATHSRYGGSRPRPVRAAQRE